MSQPSVLIQRFMLNLRQLASRNEENSDAQHFSRFSVNFRVSIDLIGNIGEPLEHGDGDHSWQGDHTDDIVGVAEGSETVSRPSSLNRATSLALNNLADKDSENTKSPSPSSRSQDTSEIEEDHTRIGGAHLGV